MVVDPRTSTPRELVGHLFGLRMTQRWPDVEEQLSLVRHPSPEVRTELAHALELSEEVQEVLAEDEHFSVLEALIDNRASHASTTVQRRLVERYLGAAGRGLDVKLSSFGEAGQLHVIARGSPSDVYAESLALTSPHPSVHRAAFEVLTPYQMAIVAVANAQVSDELLWEKLDPTDIDTSMLARICALVDHQKTPPGVVAVIRANKEMVLQGALVYNSSWTLTPDMRVQALLTRPRGQEFLGTFRPADAAAWDALVGSWNGTVEELVVACEELGGE